MRGLISGSSELPEVPKKGPFAYFKKPTGERIKPPKMVDVSSACFAPNHVLSIRMKLEDFMNFENIKAQQPKDPFKKLVYYSAALEAQSFHNVPLDLSPDKGCLLEIKKLISNKVELQDLAISVVTNMMTISSPSAKLASMAILSIIPPARLRDSRVFDGRKYIKRSEFLANELIRTIQKDQHPDNVKAAVLAALNMKDALTSQFKAALKKAARGVIKLKEDEKKKGREIYSGIYSEETIEYLKGMVATF